MYKPFGNGVQLDTLYGEGLHIIPPWNDLTKYEFRIQKDTFLVKVLTQDGMYIDIQAAIHFRPDTSRLALLHEHVGPNYKQRIVLPLVIRNTREIFGRYRHQQIYTEEEYIEDLVIRESIYDLKARYVTLLDIPFHYIQLPKTLSDAIEDKLRHEQVVKKYDYMIAVARKEAIRKQIEALGIRDFQRTVTEGITQDYLIYKGIKATLDLAKSNNSKVVVIGNSKNGLPLILDTKSNDMSDWISTSDSARSANRSAAKSAGSNIANTTTDADFSPDSMNSRINAKVDSLMNWFN